ncbi:stress response translation initiation inhibitor YciH [Candidatus Micrarchaeota archaeon]|nr:stress response translation initiation inhibitor YciH [Candidatus Micrarchaeota archaeon]
MGEICSKCGLPKEICACEALEREGAKRIKIYSTKKKFGKLVTIVEGLDEGELNKISKELKRALACGGSAKGGVMVLQGEHRDKLKQLLTKMGYMEDSIDVG